MDEKVGGGQLTPPTEPETDDGEAWWEEFKAEQVRAEEACRNCRFFHWYDRADDIEGACRRYAPRPVQLPTTVRGDIGLVDWPQVSHGDWCGEYERHSDYKAPDRTIRG